MLRKTYIYILFSLFLVLLFKLGFSQNDDSYLFEKELELKELYDSLFAFDGTKYYKSDAEKLEYNRQIIDIFDEILEDKNSFNYTFDSLHIQDGILFSPDKLLKIFTWNIKFSDGSYKYYGYIQYFVKNKDKVKTFKLIDKSDEIKKPLNAYLNDTNWYGCLYYKILLNKNGKKKYYTLFGWDGNNLLSNKKIIEILTFTKNNLPRFGKAMFKIEKQKSNRLIFEYANKAVMSVNYDEKLKMIIYDYLSPSKPLEKGLPQFYGPDGSYDGLFFSNGKWLHYSNIDLKKIKNSGYTSGKPRKGTYQPKRMY